MSIKFPIPGDPPLIGGIATEITERKRIEEELRASVRAREDILAVVSHDLRNPVNTIRLSVSVLLPQNPDHRMRRPLDTIGRATARMETLIDDLLDTANIDAGHFRLARSDRAAALAVEKGIELAVEHGPRQTRRRARPLHSRGIVEGHGGRISVESRPGEGAKLSFTVPIAGRP